MPSTRQQKRAKARVPAKQQLSRYGKRRRRGLAAFTAILIAIVLGSGAATFVLRASPDRAAPQRGAVKGEHWHANYEVDICGKKLQPYPYVEGEIHTHGDGKIHIHPQTQSFELDNANLGNFFLVVETDLNVDDQGRRYIRFPDGKVYTDGDTCPGSSEAQHLLVTLNGKAVDGNPAKLVLHDKDSVVVRFGPEPQGNSTIPNPLASPSPAPSAQPTAAPAKASPAPPSKKK